MADVIRKATNKFSKGLIMDFSPENTSNDVLTHALNATLLTFNGNEMSLQNDMGNARVETAFLPEGYIPVGTCEYGGIIYIVSYNPLENKSQIGCFPSPERNISNDELGISDVELSKTSFQEYVYDESNTPLYPTGVIKNITKYILLKDDKLNPGDKFLISSDENIYTESLQDLFIKNGNEFIQKENPLFKISIVSIEDSGKITYLDNSIKKYVKEIGGTTYKYHILGEGSNENFNQTNIDIDSYRNILSSGYSVFKSKISGKLAILAELVTIDSYSVTHSIEKSKTKQGEFDIFINTEVSPEFTIKDNIQTRGAQSQPNNSFNQNIITNYNEIPKLKYYYLSKSEGLLQVKSGQKTLFQNNPIKYNPDFLNTSINDILSIDDDVTLKKCGKFNFPIPNSYHGRPVKYTGLLPTDEKIYTKFSENAFYRIDKTQIEENKQFFWDSGMSFYYYNEDGETYKEVAPTDEINPEYTYYVLKLEDQYENAKRDQANKNKPLYRKKQIYEQADDVIRNDSTIEKFDYSLKHIYKIATEEERISLKYEGKRYTKDNSGNYIKLNAIPRPDQIVYIFTNVNFYQSVGYVVSDEYKNVNLYYETDEVEYVEILDEDEKNKYFDESEYEYLNDAPLYGYPEIFYYKLAQQKATYVLATEEQIKNKDQQLYYDSLYIRINSDNFDSDLFNNKQWFISSEHDTFVSNNKFVPNQNYNKLDNYEGSPLSESVKNLEPKDGYPKDDILELYTIADFIPSNDPSDVDNFIKYSKIKLASIKIPKYFNNKCGFPFKYNYTLVPCMNYGRLDHLKISNSINFENLYNFDQSKFTTWKYRIDGNQLRLTFGTEIFDTFEPNKVDALVLEFYDYNGFAGSIEITGKQSYSGIFTKIIYLNTLNGISNKKISGNKYTYDYKHNININTDNKLNEKFYSFNLNSGWDINDEDNDCGVLYSNLIYGVKPYLRRTNSDGSFEFIKKDDMFLFTIPIYNSYYHSREDFNLIPNPTLKFNLSCRLEDKGIKSVYNDNNIINGYDSATYKNIQDYNSGNYSSDRLEFIKYYKYSGNINLYLDLVLDKKYEEFNLSYDHKINECFSTTLALASDNDPNNVFEIISENTLNYENNDFNNYVLLQNNSTENDDIDKLSRYNYLNLLGIPEGEESYKIKYQFVVGYKGMISGMVSQELNTGIVHALCYEKNGKYNYDDFGIYERDNDYLSNFAICLEGNSTTSCVSYCKQSGYWKSNTDNGKRLNDYFNKEHVIVNNNSLLSNTNSLMSTCKESLGKYTFCIPQLLGLDTKYGVNIHNVFNINDTNWNNNSQYMENGTPYYGICPTGIESEVSDSPDVVKGLFPSNALFNWNLFSMMPIINGIFTNSISEIYSALSYRYQWYVENSSNNKYVQNVRYNNKDNKWEERHQDSLLSEFCYFKGISPTKIKNFNKCLLETMKNVYVYDPDYKVKVRKGNVNLEKTNVSFMTNLLCKNSKITYGSGKNLNNYLGLNGIYVSDYLTLLNERSNISITEDNKIKSQLEFKLDIENLGENNYCLLNSLKFNTSEPMELIDEFNYTSSGVTVLYNNMVNVINNVQLENKNRLYYYDSEKNTLIELDVKNYEINNNGKLTIKSNIVGNYAENSIIQQPKTENYYYFAENRHYKIDNAYTNAKLRHAEMTLNDLIYYYNDDNHNLYLNANLYKRPDNDKNRLKIYFREIKAYNDEDNPIDDWNYNSTKDNNYIELKTGPCINSIYDK